MSSIGIYEALSDFIQETLPLVPHEGDVSLQVELPEGGHGKEWTGVIISRLPRESVEKTFISGAKHVGYSFQFISSQSVVYDHETLIRHAVFLEDVTAKLQERFINKEYPSLPKGVKLLSISALQQSGQYFSDGSTSKYLQDIKFLLELRS